MRLFLVLLGLACATLPARAQQQFQRVDSLVEADQDSLAVARVAQRFADALRAGDREAVEALFTDDVRILESGGVETREAYFAHHYELDVAFSQAMTREPGTYELHVAGDVAWVASTSRLHGTYRDRARDLDSAELLVLRRDPAAPDGWRIAAVHWSSRTRD